MNRKHFISSVLMGAGSLKAMARFSQEAGDEEAGQPNRAEGEALRKIPPYLKAGDTIGITCPAGFITEDEILPAIHQIQSWGLIVRLGATIGKKDFTFGGTDEERASDFQRMLDDSKVKAILCARGGYGAVRIIDRLSFSKMALRPKWIIGFSDITVIHSHLNHNYGIASIHSKMCNSFPDDWSKADPMQVDTILSIKKALMGNKMKYEVNANPYNRNGRGEGVLVGGNLKTLESLSGSISDIRTAGKILFVEDTGEYLYSIDRMFWNLKRTGKLSQLKGLIVGGFRIKPDDPGEEFGKSVEEIVMEKIKSYRYPVCFDFPVGHQKNNFALKCGLRHRLEVGAAISTLTEIR